LGLRFSREIKLEVKIKFNHLRRIGRIVRFRGHWNIKGLQPLRRSLAANFFTSTIFPDFTPSLYPYTPRTDPESRKQRIRLNSGTEQYEAIVIDCHCNSSLVSNSY